MLWYQYCDFLFIYMKLKNLEKQDNYILNYIYKKKKTPEGTQYSFSK